MPRIELSFSTASVVVLLLLACCAVVSYFYYRQTVPPVAARTRILLTALRGAGLFLAALLLLEPIMRITRTSTEPPIIAILADNSKSMQLEDNSGNRSVSLRSALRQLEDISLPSGGEFRYYSFGRTLQPTSAHDSLTLTEDVTDISAALSGLSRSKDQLNLQGTILLTDGSSNTGENPVYEAARLGVPLATIGIGDSLYPRDVLLTRINTNQVVYENTSVPVDVTMKSIGFEGQSIEVTLEQEGKVADRQRVRVGAGSREYTVRFTYVPEGEGTKKCVVHIAALEGELTTRNNRMGFYTKVLKGKLRLLIVAGTPSTDLSVIRQTLAEQEPFSVDTRTQTQQGRFYEGPLTPSLIDSADCLLLLGFPASTTTPADMETIRKALDGQRKPLLFIAGKSLDGNRLHECVPVLPVTSLSSSLREEVVFLDPLESRIAHPLLTGGDIQWEAWKKLPPIFRTRSTFKVKTEASALGVARIDGVNLQDPLLAIRHVNNQKSVAILAYGLWRWRLMAQGDPLTGDHLASFLSTCIRWLTTLDDQRPVKVVPTTEFSTQGEPVEFTGQVYDATARPVDNAEVRVVATAGDQRFEASLAPVGNGRYEGALEGLPGGEYTFTATGSSSGHRLGEDRGRFSVGELNLEFRDTRMNAGLLRELARRTGGSFLTSGTFDSFNDLFGSPTFFSGREVQHETEFELWNWTYSLALILVLFSLEWFIRKRSGMV